MGVEEADAVTGIVGARRGSEQSQDGRAPLAEVVDLRFFCGFTVAEIAAMRGVSERTVQRDWEKARAFLHRGIRAAPRG